MIQFQRIQTTPVLARGATYDGWKADALAAPSACWDGTRWVMALSAWDGTQSKWATLFFISLNLTVWTYVTGSLRAPQGSDYLYGNGGLAWFGGKYWHAYSHYAAGVTNQATALENSTNLLAWTAVADPLLAPSAEDVSGQYDPSLAVNPVTGKLENWYAGVAANGTQTLCYADSATGAAGSWVKHGPQYGRGALTTVALGEPQAVYLSGKRTLFFDQSNEASYRCIGQIQRKSDDATWIEAGSALGSNPFSTWEYIQVFDNCHVGIFDRNDGQGAREYMLYAGSINTSGGDDTASSIGLAYRALPAAPSTILPITLTKSKPFGF